MPNFWYLETAWWLTVAEGVFDGWVCVTVGLWWARICESVYLLYLVAGWPVGIRVLMFPSLPIFKVYKSICGSCSLSFNCSFYRPIIQTEWRGRLVIHILVQFHWSGLGHIESIVTTGYHFTMTEWQQIAVCLFPRWSWDFHPSMWCLFTFSCHTGNWACVPNIALFANLAAPNWLLSSGAAVLEVKIIFSM